jgi:hypothetical protein
VPIESRIFVKTSLISLILAFVWGAAMAIAESAAIPINPIWAVEHAHLAFVGWLVNVVIGIALWLLPLARDVYPATAGRYPPKMPFVMYGLLNGGLMLRIASEPFVSAGVIARATLIVGSLAQVAAIALFTIVAWRRVRAPKRPAPGVH